MKRTAYVASAFAVLIALFGFVRWQYYPMIKVGINYKAKVLCSGVFVSKRQPASVLSEELKVDGFEALSYFTTNIDRNAKTVTVSAVGIWPGVAAYREGLGCALAIDIAPDLIRTEWLAQNEISDAPPRSAMLWPDGDQVDVSAIPSDVDRNKLSAAVTTAFAEPNPSALQRTRSVVVVHRGRIVAEQYADGFDETTAQFGWSISKSVLNALIGISINNPEVAGQLHTPLTLESTNLLSEWSGDQRSTISLGDLLRMSSGLSFREDYEDYGGDALKMLFASDNKGAFAARMPLLSAPGATWSYSSGTSNIIAYVLRSHFKRMSDYLSLPKRYLFEPIGMRSAIIEPDASGTFVASSFAYASARDWARLGLLYLQGGMWAGRRILPKGWVEMTTKPVKGAPNALYGLHFWLKIPDAPNYGEPPMPEDSFYMLGHAGQVVAIVPSRRLVVVRLGLARKRAAWKPGKILGAIAAAFPSDN